MEKFKGIETGQTSQTNPEVVEEIKKNVENMSNEEKLENGADAEKTQKGGIFSIFKSKETDPDKLKKKKEEELIKDLTALNKILKLDTGLGGLGNISSTLGYESFIKKYDINLEENGEVKEMLGNLNSLKEQLGKMEKSNEKVEKQREFNNAHFKFLGKLRKIAESKI